MEKSLRKEVIKYALSKKNSSIDNPWLKYPEHTVLRHKDSKKWFGLVMNIDRELLNLDGNGKIDILNVKCDPLMIGSLLTNKGFFSAYHMNKNYWISIALDNSVQIEDIYMMLDLSYELTDKKPKSCKKEK